MKCPECNQESVIVEGVEDGGKVLRCQACGWHQVEDKRGKGLLTDDAPVVVDGLPGQAFRRRILTE